MKVLVAYETAHGSTTATADAIAEVLRERGAEVEVLRCRTVTSVEEYDAFVVGAPVWASNWLRPARRFVRRFQRTLAEHPTAYFHASGAAGDEESREGIARVMDERLRNYAPAVEPVAIGTFGGVIDFDLYNLPIRLIMQFVLARRGHRTYGRHEMRDWERIRGWADEVYDLLAEAESC